MSELFLKILNMSISASWLVPVVLLLRLLLKKAPKWCSICLWAIVALRLLLPFSIESMVSLIPSAETISPTIMTDAAPSITSGIPSLNSVVNPVLESTLAPTPDASVNPLQVWIPVAAIVWALGIAGFAVYTAIVYLRLRRKVATAVRIRERENIYQSENVSSPFLLGIVKPRIYLPFNINEQDMEHVIAHEQAHIKRRDHWWKPLGFLLLAVYWFNPLLWLAYILLCRDIELACDEKVIKELGNEEKAAYTEALVACSVGHRLIAACPLTFGEVGVKERVKSVMKYKKPAFWIIILAIVACAVVAVCFLTNPAREEEPEKDTSEVVAGTSEAENGNSENSEGNSDMENDHHETDEIEWPAKLLPAGFPVADYDKIYSAERKGNEVTIILFGELLDENFSPKNTNAKMFASKLIQAGYLVCDVMETSERFYISRDGYKVTLADSESWTGDHLASINEESPTGYTFEIQVEHFDVEAYEYLFWKYPGANTDLGLEPKVFDAWPTESLPEGFDKPGDKIEILEIEQKKNGLFITLKGARKDVDEYLTKAQKSAGYIYGVGDVLVKSNGDYIHFEPAELEKIDGEYMATVRFQFCPANDRIKK